VSVQGKGLIFVNDVDKCYRLKLFLQQFFISAAVLNGELPVNSRTHIIEVLAPHSPHSSLTAQEFNRGVFDYLIATDALVDRGEEEDEDEDQASQEGEGEEGKQGGDEDEEGDEEEEEDEEAEDDLDFGDEEEDEDEDSEEPDFDEEDEEGEEDEDEEAEEEGDDDEAGEEDASGDEEKATGRGSKKKESRLSSKKGAKGKSFDLFGDGYGVSRGIDFKGVAFVINFDFPTTAAAYTHRIGRTARGGATGTSLSFVTLPPVCVSTSLPSQRTTISLEVSERDEDILRTVQQQQPRLGYDASAAASGSNVLAAMGSTQLYDEEVLDERCLQPSPLVFNMRELESFRYRVEDTLRAVTSAAVKELRAAEIKREILNSKQLKSYFSENPTDLKVPPLPAPSFSASPHSLCKGFASRQSCSSSNSNERASETCARVFGPTEHEKCRSEQE
jgi:ATP-dependent RNA helicase DDX56/DBP9